MSKPLTKKEWETSVAEMWSEAVKSTCQDLIDEAVKAEREECAKLCQELLERPSGYQGRWECYGKFKTQMTGQECADAIRARGQA